MSAHRTGKKSSVDMTDFEETVSGVELSENGNRALHGVAGFGSQQQETSVVAMPAFGVSDAAYLAGSAADNHSAEGTLSADGTIAADAYLSGGKWGPSGTLGTTGGTVTWSIAGADLSYQPGRYTTSSFFTGTTVALSSFLPADYVIQITNALATWSAVADINFVQVADGGGDFGVGTNANIRIGGGYIDGDGNGIVGMAFYAPGNFGGGTSHAFALDGDIVFDSSNTWTDQLLFGVALHEIGHALGLAHVPQDTAAIMNPFVHLGIGLQVEDIANIQAVYGARTQTAPGSVSINDVTITEGDNGTKTLTFTVTRSGGTAAFDVNFATSDGTATVADGDFVATSNALHFGAGENSKTISVTINGDTKVEANESFNVLLSGATNGAIISDSQGIGNISNDDVALFDAPIITSNSGGDTASVSITENTTAVTTVTATDPDAGQTLSYMISGGADASKFTIDPSTGALSFISAPNFELPTDAGANNVYDVIVQASDYDHGGIDAQAIAVTVTDVFENSAPTITSNGGGNTAALSIVENTTAVTTVTATDPEAGQAVSYAISGGADASKFTINAGTGALSFITAPNFEAPTDAGHNNVYDVIVQTWDSYGDIDTQALSVSVQNAADGNADILWQNNINGTPALWQMDGLSPTRGAVLPNPGPAWHVVDAGDFNGDGNADIVWQGSDGTPAMWLMEDDKPVWVGAVGPFNPGPNWEIKGTGDFNGDGNADIVWQGSDGTPAVWMMDGTHVDWLGTVGPFNPGPNWEIKGTGDFNGDGNDDILWQGSDGTPAVWMMDGAHVDWLGTVGPFNPGPNWEIKGTGDFNGDGRSDILWQGSDGTPAIWLMDGASAVSVGVAGSFNPGPSWEVKGAADVNGDGNSDILWQGSNGTPAVWLMDGLSATAVAGLPNLGADWHIIA